MAGLRAFSRREAIALAGGMVISAGSARAESAAPARGGILTSTLSPEPPGIIPGVNNQTSALIAGSKIFQGLVRISKDLKPLPELSKSWTMSDDRLTYSFDLEEGVKWHDGEPFTAEDVIFSIKKYHQELSPRARGIFGKIMEAVAETSHRVRFKLDSPFEPFLLMLDVSSTAIVPRHIYEGTDFRNNPANQTPVGTGPFRFVEFQRGNLIRLRRNEEYWKKGLPYLDEIVFRLVPDSQGRALALQTGEVLMTAGNDIEPFDVPRFKVQSNLAVETTGWECFSPMSWLDLNHRSKPLDDVRVRQALARAIDRDFIIKRLWFDVSKVATGPIASTTRFYDPAASVLPAYDPKAANDILDAAGYAKNAQGVRFKIRHLVLPYGEVYVRVSEYMRTAFKQVGIDLVLESTDVGGWASRIAAWDYDTTLAFNYQWADPSLGVERSYVTANIQHVPFSNTGGYSNPKVDAAFARGRTEYEIAERQAAFTDATRLLIEDMAQIWFVELRLPTIHDVRVKNLVQLGTGVHSSFDEVYLG